MAASDPVGRPKIMAENFQRVGAVSNAHVGRDFEKSAKLLLSRRGINVEPNHSVEVGIGKIKKRHSFDLGANNPPIIVECKSHRWTKSGNVPSAKVTVWNEAMYYFSCAPNHYRKIFFVLRDVRATNGETLASYYIRTYAHLIPSDVEIWEYDEATSQAEIVDGA